MRIVSWNVKQLAKPWRMLAADTLLDVALLQEATPPPDDFAGTVVPARDSDWRMPGYQRAFRTAIAGLSSRVTVRARRTVGRHDDGRTAHPMRDRRAVACRPGVCPVGRVRWRSGPAARPALRSHRGSGRGHHVERARLPGRARGCHDHRGGAGSVSTYAGGRVSAGAVRGACRGVCQPIRAKRLTFPGLPIFLRPGRERPRRDAQASAQGSDVGRSRYAARSCLPKHPPEPGRGMSGPTGRRPSKSLDTSVRWIYVGLHGREAPQADGGTQIRGDSDPREQGGEGILDEGRAVEGTRSE